MYCVIIAKSLCKNYIPLLFYNSDDVVTSCVKLKFSFTHFCKRRVVILLLQNDLLPNSINNTCLETSIYRLKKTYFNIDLKIYRRRSDLDIGCPDGKLQSPFHNACHAFLIKAVSGRCCLASGWLQVVLPIHVCKGFQLLLEHWLVSGQYCPIVWIDICKLCRIFSTQMGVQMFHWPARTKTRDSIFAELSMAQNLPRTLKLPSLMLMTLKLVIIPFPY